MDALELIPRAGHLVAHDFSNDRAAWLAARRTGIGGSDVAAILGLSPWATPIMVWRDKTGRDPDGAATWSMKIGTAMEATIAETWAASVGATLYDLPFLRDATHPHRLASVDRVAVMPDGTVALVEVKWSAQGFDEVPAHYLTQIVWYMAILGLHRAYLVVGGPYTEPRGLPVEFDPDLAADIVAACDRFWADHIVADIEPAPQNADERKGVALRRLEGSTAEVDADDATEAIAAELVAAKAALEEAEASVKGIEAALSEAMAARMAAKVRGQGWTAQVIEKAGAVSYAAYCKRAGIPAEALEAFRGKPSRYVMFRQDKPGKEG